MFLRYRKFYSPDDSETITPEGNTADSVNPSDADDVIKFLEGDETTDDNKPLDLGKAKKEEVVEDEETPDEEKEGDEEEVDEIQELVDETEEPSEEQLELTTPVRRREILTKYPNLFKDFPYLEKAYYREQQFTELLPTINDAKEAVAKSQTLDRFEGDLMDGNLGTILAAVSEQSPNSFNKIVDNIMPTIAKVSDKAYHHILGNTLKHTIVAMVNEGKTSNNESLLAAAQILNQFAFGSSEFKPPTNLATEEPKDKKPNDLSQREMDFNRRQFETAHTDLNTRVNNSLKATIEANIDPKNSMTDYVKRNAVREVSETLQKLIQQDKRFGTIIDRLWEDAFKTKFNKDSTDRIRAAYLSKSKTLLPSIIKRARIEALKGMGKRVREVSDETTPSKGQKNERPRSSGNSGNKKDIPKGMRTLDFLMQD